jgi:hypothetical protein
MNRQRQYGGRKDETHCQHAIAGFSFVIAALGAAIPIRDAGPCLPKRDGRDKPGHDKKHAERRSHPALPAHREFKIASASMQSKLAFDRADFRRLDQLAMRHRHRMQNALERTLPELQEALQLRELRKEIVFLPNVGLQQPRVVRPPIEDLRGGQAIAIELALKVF